MSGRIVTRFFRSSGMSASPLVSLPENLAESCVYVQVGHREATQFGGPHAGIHQKNDQGFVPLSVR